MTEHQQAGRDARASSARASRFGALAGTVIPLALFTGGVLYLWPNCIDDAYISARYARNLAAGHGLVYQVGDAPVEGYSNFLFVLLTALGAVLGAEPIVAAKVVSCICGYLCVLLLAPTARLVLPHRYYLVPILWTACFPAAYWSVTGMETSLMALMVLLWLHGALVVAARPDRSAGHWLLGAASVALPLVRPEGVLFVGAYAVVLVLLWKQQARRSDWRGLVVVVALLAAYSGWKLAYFGGLLPLTFYAKVDVSSWGQKLSGLLYVHKFLWQYLGGALGYLALLYGLLRWLPKAKRCLPLSLSLLAAFPLLLFVVLAGSDWMPQFRFLMPVLAPVYILLVALLAALAGALRGTPLSPRLAMWGGVVSVLIGNGIGAFAALQDGQWHATRSEMIGFHTSALRVMAAQGRWLKEQGGAELTVAAMDIGAVGYYSDSRLIDMHGLTNADVAGKDRSFVADYVLARTPDYIQAYGHPLNSDPAFRRNYVRVEELGWSLYARKERRAGIETR